MRIKGAVSVNASQEEVWSMFLDPIQFSKVMPGFEKARRLDDTHYEAILAVKVPFLTIRSKAKGTILEAQAPRHIVGELSGDPHSVSGSFRNRVTIDLVPINNKTKIEYTMEITMLGRLAGVGEAVAGLIARRFSKEFTENVSNLFNKPKRR
jgi:carbon monoxide dehydrogenase subunit G